MTKASQGQIEVDGDGQAQQTGTSVCEQGAASLQE